FMRFKIELALENPVENLLPVNYQYELSSWIYNISLLSGYKSNSFNWL
ncbi:unnamed protein product, partial [marine sediment metagenome]